MSNFLANWHLVFAAVTIALIPVLLAFFIFSEQLVAGLTAGSVKE
jgi:raffinose/stachyose/melibiose transport system permease protein